MALRRPPAEPNVSPAVLAALRRPVELRPDQASLQLVALELTVAVDLPVLIDARVPVTSLVPEQTSGQLWEVLQTVARQSNLRVLPRANQLVLLPIDAPDPEAEAEQRRAFRPNQDMLTRATLQYEPEDAPLPAEARKPAPASTAGPAGAPGPAGPAGPAVVAPPPAPAAVPRARGAAGSALGMGFRVAGRQTPDRRVWRFAEWGNLPVRGFLPAKGDAGAKKTRSKGTRTAPK
jgi:hypothetical protein